MDLIYLDGVDAYTAITRLSEQVEAFEAVCIHVDGGDDRQTCMIYHTAVIN